MGNPEKNGKNVNRNEQKDPETVVFNTSSVVFEEEPVAPLIQPKKSKAPLIAAVSCAAVLCIGAAAAIIAVNANRPNVTPVAAAESAYTDSAAPAADGGNQTESAVSKGGHNITENPFEQPSDSTKTSEASAKQSKTQESSQKDNFFGDNVTVMGMNLKGLTLSEAFDKLQGSVLSMRKPVSITIHCEDETIRLTENDFTFNSDLSDVLLDAYRYSRKEQPLPSYEVSLKNDVTDYVVSCWMDEKSVNEVINNVKKQLNDEPVNAHVVSFDPNATEKFTYADGHDGMTVDQKELEKNLRKILDSDDKTGSFTLKRSVTPFTVTLADVKANTKLIASHHTTAMNVYNSNYNMGLALRSASGTILNPGETFSFNETTGDTTNGYTHYYDNGTVGAYLQSTSIVGGQYVAEYGGGICQASTTLYICAMKAGLTAVERYPHAYPSAYCSKGLDATINYGALDMKFKNKVEITIQL